MVSATKDEIESDIALFGDDGERTGRIHRFHAAIAERSSSMSPERVDKGLYEIQWIAHTEIQNDQAEKAAASDSLSWLVFLDGDGIGTTVADQLRRSGHRVRVVLHQPVAALTKIDGGYALNPRRPEQLNRLIRTHLENEGDLAGIINCWPLDIRAESDGRHAATSVK